MSLVWSAAPLAGFFIQPIVGHYSDRCLSKIGRRRPFILVGGIGVLIGLILMFYAERIGSLFSRTYANTISIGIFSFQIIWMNVFLNILQGPARAILGDVIPQSQQVMANAIASFMMSMGVVVSSIVGGARFISIGQYISSEKLVIIISAILIITGLAMTLWSAHEEPLYEVPPKQNSFRRVVEAAFSMPPAIFRIAIIYLFSWMSYFPYQITITDFFGTDVFGGSSDFESGERHIYDDGVSFGMFVVAMSSALTTIYTPLQSLIVKKVSIKVLYGISHLIAALCFFAIIFVNNKWALLCITLPIGIAFSVFNSVPYAIVGLIVMPEQMGVYMGVLNCFAVFGQQLSLSLQCAVVGSIFKAKAKIIGSGGLFALIAAILCTTIIVPETDESNVQNLLTADPFKSHRQ